MFQTFDTALARALTSEHALFGAPDRRVATATARRAAAENRVKALNEATLGKAGFAAIHDTASTRYHEHAELMALGQPPVHHAISFYLSTAETYRKADTRSGAPDQLVCAVPRRPAQAA